ncbi:MAG: hypothetical protein JKY22_11925 [Flavobacteriaceae bacterium]|nr:hypothetical protein [Flavobacteriaceae bacterium]
MRKIIIVFAIIFTTISYADAQRIKVSSQLQKAPLGTEHILVSDSLTGKLSYETLSSKLAGSDTLPAGGSDGDILQTDGLGNYTWVTPLFGDTQDLSIEGSTISLVDGGSVDVSTRLIYYVDDVAATSGGVVFEQEYKLDVGNDYGVAKGTVRVRQ